MRITTLTTAACLWMVLYGSGTAAAQQYRTYAQVVASLKNLAANAPNVARYVSMGTSIEGREIPGIKITLDPGSDHPDRADVLFVGGHHAREWISIEVPLRLAEYLVANEGRIGGLAEMNEIWIFPLINPDGYLYTSLPDAPNTAIRDRHRYWRRNRHLFPGEVPGVDLNRNYSVGFGGEGSSDDHGSDVYRGTAAFSEPETRAVKTFVESREAVKNPITRMLSYHAFSQLILYPWGHIDDSAPESSLLRQMAEEMRDRIDAVGRTYTAHQSKDLYNAGGVLDDWAYGEKGILAFTIELPPARGPLDGIPTIGLPKFELPPSEIVPTFQENLPGALYLISFRRGRLMDFETQSSDQAPIRSTIPGMQFTTTAGQDWIYGDQRLPAYNVHSVDAPDNTNYATFGNFFAWLGVNQGTGRIDFTDAGHKTLGVSYSSLNATVLEGFDANGALVQRVSGPGNLNTNRLDRLTISGPIKYAQVHDAGNFWLIDNLFVTDALGDAAALLPGKTNKELQVLETFQTGQTKRFTVFNRKGGADLKFIVQWPGSTFRVVVRNPFGEIVDDRTDNQPPIVIDVPGAVGGNWTADVTAVDVNQDEPLGLVVGLFDTNDIDDDGVMNLQDNCVGTKNTDQADADGDGAGDRCDNCRTMINPGQEDKLPWGAEGGGNGVGDVCEATVAGDLDLDGDVDQNDITIASADRGRTVSASDVGPRADLDRDGRITVVDLRRLALLCTRAGCRVQ